MKAADSAHNDNKKAARHVSYSCYYPLLVLGKKRPFVPGCYYHTHHTDNATVPLREAEWDSPNCPQISSHCHSDLRSGRQCAALCRPASLNRWSAARSVLGQVKLYERPPQLVDAAFEFAAVCSPPKGACWADEWPPWLADCEQRPQWRHCRQMFQVETGWSLVIKRVCLATNCNLKNHSTYVIFLIFNYIITPRGKQAKHCGHKRSLWTFYSGLCATCVAY